MHNFPHNVSVLSWHPELSGGGRRGIAIINVASIGIVPVSAYSFGGHSWVELYPSGFRQPKLTRAQWRRLHDALDDIRAAIAAAFPDAFDNSPEIFRQQAHDEATS